MDLSKDKRQPEDLWSQEAEHRLASVVYKVLVVLAALLFVAVTEDETTYVSCDLGFGSTCVA